MEAVKVEEKKEEVIGEVTEETEFLKGWNSEQDNLVKEKEPDPIIPEPEPEKEEAVVVEASTEIETKPVEEKPQETITETVESDNTAKPEFKKPADGEDENSITNYRRWRTAEGIIKAERGKREEAERKAKELEDKLSVKPEVKPVETQSDEEDTELDKLEDKYFDAMLGDNKDEAKVIRKQINAIKFDRLASVTQKEATAVVNTEFSNKVLTEAVEQVKLESEKKYPFLDVAKPNTCNPYAVRLVQAVRDDYRGQGLSFADALKRAVEEVAPMFSEKVVTDKLIVEPKGEPVDKDKLESTVVVNSIKSPVKIGGKHKGATTFDEGFDSVI